MSELGRLMWSGEGERTQGTEDKMGHLSPRHILLQWCQRYIVDQEGYEFDADKV